MAYGETKVYFDGSHYIAIPHTTRPSKKRPSPPEEIITVKDVENDIEEQESPTFTEVEAFELQDNEVEIEEEQTNTMVVAEKAQKGRILTRKEFFEELYRESQNLSKYQRKSYILDKMLPYFDSPQKANDYVEVNLARKKRNLICRRIRMSRKANLQNFNYFCTFTYSDEKHTEDSFKKRLSETLNRFSTRKKWKYIGVWERSPEKKRLHFHGIFYIPTTKGLGEMLERRDFSFAKHDMITTYTYSYFEKTFGRADFEPIDDRNKIGNALAYLMKYLEKTGEKIIYSKGLPQYFISDIMDEDIVCTIGQEETKLLLFDDFSCWDEGCYIGQVSPEVIEQMRKAN